MNRARNIARRHEFSKQEFGPPPVKVNARNRRKNAAAALRQKRYEAEVDNRINNLLVKVVEQSGPDLSTLSRDDLRKLAQTHAIAGRGSMTKAQLVEALEKIQ